MKTQKVYIDQVEEWPVFIMTVEGAGKEINVPAHALKRWNKAMNDYNKAQAEMRAVFNGQVLAL